MEGFLRTPRGLLVACCCAVLGGCGGGGAGAEPVPDVFPASPARNAEPALRVEHGPLAGAVPHAFWADAGASTDPEGGALAFEWFVDGAPAGGEPGFSHTFDTAGRFDLRVEATDAGGAKASRTLVVQVDQAGGVRGRLFTGAGIVLDGDVNDPALPRRANDRLASAQHVDGSFEAITGYVGAQGTGPADGAAHDRGDQRDYFSIAARKGDFLRLVIADRGQDLDLVLYEEDGTRLAASVGVTNVELVGPVPADGRYIAEVRVFGASASLYRLALAQRPDPFEVASRITPTTDMDPEHLLVSAGMDAAWSPDRSGRRVVAIEPQTHAADGMAHDDLLPPHLRAFKRMAARYGARSVEPVLRRQALSLPQDDWFVHQWHLLRAGFPEAWQLTRGDEDVIVAVIDSGIHLAHPEFLRGSRLVPGMDFISDPDNAGDGDGVDDDPSDVAPLAGGQGFHGTHVAGIIAAEVAGPGTPSLRHSVAGAGWNLRVMPLRVLGRDGGTSADLIEAIRYAAGLPNSSGRLPEQRADVINLSLGSRSASAAERAAIDAARAEGVIVVAAAGNGSSDAPNYPAAYPGVIAVGATGPDDTLAGYSSYGDHLALVAPGGDMSADSDRDGFPDGILAPLVEKDAAGVLRPTIGLRAGTSMAAPLVAAAAGLMKAVNRDLDAELFDVLLDAGRLTVDIGDPGFDPLHGHGLLDAGSATAAALELVEGGRLPAIVTVAPRRLDFGVSAGEGEFEIALLGTSGAAVLGIEPDEPWLRTEPVDVAADGTGRYRVRVARDGLAEGAVQFGTVRVRGPENTVSVAVSARRAPLLEPRDIGPLRVQIRPMAGGGPLTRVVEADEGGYRFAVPLPEGRYYVEAGSDLDHDGRICDDGEICGVFPSRDYLVPVEVGRAGFEEVDLVLAAELSARQTD